MFCVPVLNGPSLVGRRCRVAVIRGGGRGESWPAGPGSGSRRLVLSPAGAASALCGPAPSGNAAYKTPRMAMRTDQRASRLDGEANDGWGDDYQPPTPKPPTTSVPAERRRLRRTPQRPDDLRANRDE